MVVTVNSASFGASEAVDVYFDTTDTLLLVTSGAGAFSGALTVPASATPGKHFVTAIGRRSGFAAQSAFTVQTSWAQFGFGANHLAWNPYENVVNAGNAATLGVLWDVATSGTGATPAFVGGQVYVSATTASTPITPPPAPPYGRSLSASHTQVRPCSMASSMCKVRPARSTP